VAKLAEYYFDVETTGVDFDKDEIITIQWQRLNGFTGEPIDTLNILKRWDSSEEDILKKFLPNLKCRPFDFIFVGKNLLFDFSILNERLKHYGLGEIGLRCLHERVSLDIKPILVLMNGGNFKNYDKIIPKTNPTTNDLCPKLYQQERYQEIIKYIEDEAKDFVKAYKILKKEIEPLKRYLK
jgi:DNA polymerase elongation subunit (family B)